MTDSNYTELSTEKYIREDDQPFNALFQEKFCEAMLSMISAPAYQEALACFYAAYEYRKTFPWLPESRVIPDEINQNGLSYALRAALSTFIVPHVPTKAGVDTPVPPQDVHAQDWKYTDPEKMNALVTAVAATINEGFSLKRFENQLAMANIDVATLAPAALRTYIAAALIRYYHRRQIGISRDAL